MNWHPHLPDIAGRAFVDWLADLPPAPPIRRSIIITSEERSGSEWLAQLMAATGRLGRPMEYLNAYWNGLFIPDYPQDAERQLLACHRAGVTANGILATKLHVWHFDHLKTSVKLSNAFPRPTFVRLTRRDRLGQAISLARARQTMRFHEHVEPSSPERYDPELIDKVLGELLTKAARWDHFFLRNDLRPLTIAYEELQADPCAILQAIAALVDESIVAADIVVERELKVQRDGLNEEWRRRFLSDMNDLDRFD